jgi:hypothetical protein
LLKAQRKFSACPTGFEPAKPPRFAMADHADHIHVGFTPEFDTVFSRVQWTDFSSGCGRSRTP